MSANDQIKTTLKEILYLHLHREAMTARFGENEVNSLIDRYSNEVAEFWRIAAWTRSWEDGRRSVHHDAPGYINVPAGDTLLHVPFHLVPGLPEIGILEELVELSKDVRLGDPESVICISGSSLLIKDFVRIGDIDYCEYVPSHRQEPQIHQAFLGVLSKCSGSRFAISVRTRNNPHDAFQDFDILNRGQRLTAEHIHSICKSMAEACNGKATFLARTAFAGIIEVSNWIIFHSSPPDLDPVAFKLSFAFQEAAIGVRSTRSLHFFESLVAYLNFMTGEIGKHRMSDPVKAVKRAIPLLRIFGELGLVDELLASAARHRAFSCAAAIARFEVYSRYRPLGLPPELIESLEKDCLSLTAEALGVPITDPMIDAESRMSRSLVAFAQDIERYWPTIFGLAAPSPLP